MFSSGALVPSVLNPGLSAQPPAHANAFEHLRNLLASSQVNGYQVAYTPAIAPSVPQFYVAAPTFPALVHPAAGPAALPSQGTVVPHVNYSRQHSNEYFNDRRGPGNTSSARRGESAKKPTRESRKRKRSPSPIQTASTPSQIEENIPSTPFVEPKFDFIVVDTNVMILALADISSLKQFEYFHLIVPFTVVNELDIMKMQNKDPDLRTKAQRAISYLHEQVSIASGFQWVSLQTRDQVHNVSHGGAAANYKENCDDRILDCALYAKASGKKVVLLTEDKNLSLKARCNLVEPVNVKSLLGQIPSITMWQEQRVHMETKRRKRAEAIESQAPPESSALGEKFDKIINYLAPRDLLAVQVVSRQLNQAVRNADWTSKLKSWSGDASGRLIPADSQEAQKWYIRWKRSVVPRQ